MINWDALGAIGELLGSVVILVTLVYLAMQTRELNRQSRAEARYAFVQAMSDVNLMIAQNTETASMWRRGLNAIEALSEYERMQFFMLMGQYANAWSVMHQLHEDRLLPEKQWQIVRNDVVSILGTDGGIYFWNNAGRNVFDPEFVTFVDSELTRSDRPYHMSELTVIEARPEP